MIFSENRHSEQKYPTITDDDKVYYLLLHLAVPSLFTSSLSKHINIAKQAADTFNLKLSAHIIETENNHGVFEGKSNHAPNSIRYFFRFPYYRRNDEFASRFADTVLIIASVTFGVFLDDEYDVSVFRVPANLIRNRKSVFLGELVQVEKARLRTNRIAEFSPETLIGSASQFSSEAIELAWRLTPLLLKNDRFHRAFRFLKTSQENFFVWDGEIEDVIDKAQTTAKTASQQSRFENTLEDSFKAVEAILGDPPKDDEKFFKKIESIGLDPHEKFGLEDKPIYQVIRDMSNARDKKAAHGSTPNRGITLGELLEYQNCARLIVLQASQFEINSKGKITA